MDARSRTQARRSRLHVSCKMHPSERAPNGWLPTHTHGASGELNCSVAVSRLRQRRAGGEAAAPTAVVSPTAEEASDKVSERLSSDWLSTARTSAATTSDTSERVNESLSLV